MQQPTTCVVEIDEGGGGGGGGGVGDAVPLLLLACMRDWVREGGRRVDEANEVEYEWRGVVFFF